MLLASSLKKKTAVTSLALKAMLIALCFSLSCGGAVRTLAVATMPGLKLVGPVPLRTQLPAEEAPVQEELPTESPSPTELPRGEESPSLAADQKQAKRTRDHARASNVRTLSSHVSSVAIRAASSSFEHRFRNGCGAHLRC
jgi:hypothetical protein